MSASSSRLDPGPDPDPPPDPELTHERHHLARSRVRLGEMRAKVEGLTALSGDPVSAAYLQASLWRRMQELEDDPSVPLFFGRLDYLAPAERLYIGRRHVTDAVGDPMVIDWRAGMSRPFYRASPVNPMGVGLRRRFGFSEARLTAYEDEPLDQGTVDPAAPDSSGILRAEIERPRVGPMRDIVATIQPDQDDIVRADLAESLCVQGAPGTGKTAVGLHRAAYLLYAHREQLTRQGVVVVGPNASFLRYIGDVLPALGEIEARQTTIELLTEHVPIRSTDTAEVARLKADPRMAGVVDNACWSHLSRVDEALVVPRGSRRWRLAAYEVDELVDELRERGVRYGTGRAMLAQRIAHAILLKMETAGDSPDDRVQSAVARSAPVTSFVNRTWPKLDPAKVVHRLLSDAVFLAATSADLLTEDEQRLLLWERPARSPRSARWSVHDAMLVDEAADIIDRTPSAGHVVIDEAQDLSAMMLRAVGRRASTGSVTVLGDVAQTTTPWGSRSWEAALANLGKDSAHIEQLTQGFRVPAEVIAYAARLLPLIAPQLKPPTSVRDPADSLRITEVRAVAPAVADALASTVERIGSIGVIVADSAVEAVGAALERQALAFTLLGADTDMSAHVDLVPASLAKGLEFDHVIVAEPADIVAGEADDLVGLRRLYVCLTRAVTSLLVLHASPLPEALR